MRKVREVLRQRYACGTSERVIAQSLGNRPHCGLGNTSARGRDRITWPFPDELDEAALERSCLRRRVYNPPQSKPQPTGPTVHAELRRRSVTLALLWQVLLSRPASRRRGYGYSRFCDLYGRMAPRRDGDHAPDPCRGREAVRGLCRRHHAGVRCDHRGGELRPSSLSQFWGPRTTPMSKPASARGCRLDRGSCQRACIPRRSAEGNRLRQSQGRGHDRQPIRGGCKPNLSGPRRPLRHDHHADAPRKPRDKAKVESRRPDRAALGPGAAA